MTHRTRSVLSLVLGLVCGSRVGEGQPVARFHGRERPLDAATRALMSAPGAGSWHPGCPVALDDLRLLELNHWGFDGAVHVGRLVVHRAHAGRLLSAFGELFAARFAIERMELVDSYGSDDHRSMAANNTSAFNCREVNGRPGVWSEHAYGLAIDVNPVQNPFVSGAIVSPPAGVLYLRRDGRAPGMIVEGGAALRAFERAGWRWGGRWRTQRDWQHFSASGR